MPLVPILVPTLGLLTGLLRVRVGVHVLVRVLVGVGTGVGVSVGVRVQVRMRVRVRAGATWCRCTSLSRLTWCDTSRDNERHLAFRLISNSPTFMAFCDLRSECESPCRRAKGRKCSLRPVLIRGRCCTHL